MRQRSALVYLFLFLLASTEALSSDSERLTANTFLQPEQNAFYQFYLGLPDPVEVSQRGRSDKAKVKIPKKELVGSICGHFIKTVRTLEQGGYGDVDREQMENMTNHSFRLCKLRIPKIKARLQ